jgi:hypothetical protein
MHGFTDNFEDASGILLGTVLSPLFLIAGLVLLNWRTSGPHGWGILLIVLSCCRFLWCIGLFYGGLKRQSKLQTRNGGFINGCQFAVLLVLTGELVLGIAMISHIDLTRSATRSLGTAQAAPITTKDAWGKIGKSATVEFYVSKAVETSAGSVFLDEKNDYANGFVAALLWRSRSAFRSDMVSYYEGKTIRVSGKVTRYAGHPQILLTQPSQISLVSASTAKPRTRTPITISGSGTSSSSYSYDGGYEPSADYYDYSDPNLDDIPEYDPTDQPW